MNDFQTLVSELRSATNASRVTLRQDVPGDYLYPVTHEALDEGVESLRDFRVLDQVSSPTFKRIGRERQMIVQEDCRAAAAGADPEYAVDYHRDLIELYGGLSAFIALPVFIGERLSAVISVHELRGPRRWSAEEIEVSRAAAEQVRRLVSGEPNGAANTTDGDGRSVTSKTARK